MWALHENAASFVVKFLVFGSEDQFNVSLIPMLAQFLQSKADNRYLELYSFLDL